MQEEVTSPTPAMDIGIRRLLPTDMSFLFTAWKHSYRKWTDGSKGRPDWSSRFYNTEMDARILRILDRLPKVRLAVDPLDPNYIYGWIVAEPPILHYVFVKPPYRPAGVAHQLLAAVGMADCSKIYCTHWTASADHAAKKLPLVNIET